MRALMERERPPFGFWDMKLGEGGLVDIEFTAQFLQIVHAGQGGPLAQNTAIALEALKSAGLANPSTIASLLGAWRLQQNLTELLKLALDDRTDPEFEPTAFHALLARAGNAKDFKALKTILTAARTAARAAYDAIVRPSAAKLPG